MSTTANYVVAQAFPALAGFFNVVTASVSTNQQITLPTFSNILTAVAVRQDTFATITITFTGNVITITQLGLTNVNIVILIGGTRA